MGKALGGTARSDLAVAVRPWPHDPSTRHLVVLDLHLRPGSDDVAGWVAGVFEAAPEVERIRTGALFPAHVPVFEACGFVVSDRLTLLERPLPRTGRLPRPERPDGISIRTLRRRDLAAAATIDVAAFPRGWGNDESSLRDIATATPVSSGRIATDRRRPVGFALLGKAGPTAYLQRLAVHPDHHRRGLARALVDDAIHRMTRRGATRLVVNTGVDNEPALSLYADTGFRRCPDELVVMDRHR